MFGYIYMTINTVNGKKYIGQHKSSEFEGNKYLDSGKILKQAIEKYGALKGGFMALWRIIRCNPFSKGGYDPVP